MYRCADAVLPPAALAGQTCPAHLYDGWRARLSLGFACRDGRTVLARRSHVGPLTVQKPLYPEGGAICHAVILHPPGGLAGGDDLDIQVQVDEGAHAVLTTPGATKWYKAMPDQPASQCVDIELKPGARIDWLPQDNIFFDASQARQRFRLRVGDGATALGWDATLLGRQGRGERWTGATLRSVVRIEASDGHALWEERQAMASGDPVLTAPQGLGGWPAYGTLWAVGEACTTELAHSLASELPFDDRLRSGVTALPGGVLLVRAVSREPEPLRRLFVTLWLALRPRVHGVAAQPLRLWAT